MTTKTVVIGATIALLVILSNMVTYQVDSHFDYDTDQEETITELQEKIEDLSDKNKVLNLDKFNGAQDGPSK